VAVSRLCETGRIFVEHNGQNLECAAVAFIIAEDAERRWLKREPVDFYTTKHHVGALASSAGIELGRQPLSPQGGDHHGWQEGHSALAGDWAHGWHARFGLLNLAMVRGLGIEGKVYGGVFAILPEKISTDISADSLRKRYSDFSLFPAALRDIALAVNTAVHADEVRKQLFKIARLVVGNGFAVERVQPFDVYQGKGLPEGTKSLAFSLVFRAADRTLTDDEVNIAFTKIQDELAKSTDYTLRK
jgi:phenylalanyl-tRNA synthetase beta chain